MVAPLIIAAGITAAAAIAASQQAAAAQRDASSANAAINQGNLNAGDRERLQAQFIADRNRAEQQLGTTDAFGNKTEFVPGVGLVTTASDGTQRLIDASRFEQEQQFGDARRARSVREDVTDRARESGQTADSLLQEFQRQRPGERGKIKQSLDAETTKGFNQGFDEVQDAALTQQVRAGASADTLGTAIGKAGEQRGGALSRLLAGNAGQANAQFEQSKDRSGLANLFNAFSANAAGAPSGVPVPSNAGTQANALTALFANRLGQGDAGVLNAASRVGGRADFIRPDLSGATATAQGGDALASFFSALQGQSNSSGFANAINQDSTQLGFGTNRAREGLFSDAAFGGGRF